MTFRAIDTTRLKPATLRDQQAPTLSWVEVAQLVIDDRYQRAITPQGWRAIQRIADDWDWSKFQPILVAATADGRFAVVDGQHRAHAAAVTGLASLPAMIVPLTPAEQARAFVAVNTTRIKLSATNVFRAQLAAGDELAAEAARIVAAAGCRLMTYNPSASQRKPGDIFAHGTILKMVEAGEGEVVELGLRAIRESITGSDPEADAYGYARRVWDAGVLRPWLAALASNQRFLRLPLARVFDGIDWDEMSADASRRHRVLGGPKSQHMIEAVTQVLRAARDRADAA